MSPRILPYGAFVTTSGAALPIDLGTLAEIRRSILRRHATDKDGCCLVSGGRQKAADLAMAIIRLCLSRHALDRIQYADALWRR